MPWNDHKRLVSRKALAQSPVDSENKNRSIGAPRLQQQHKAPSAAFTKPLLKARGAQAARPMQVPQQPTVMRLDGSRSILAGQLQEQVFQIAFLGRKVGNRLAVFPDIVQDVADTDLTWTVAEYQPPRRY